MRVYDIERDLPLRKAGFIFMCPNCREHHANVGRNGCLITCPSCNYSWRTQINGKPKTQLITT